MPDYARADLTAANPIEMDDVTRQQIKDSIVMVDPITRLFVKNALYFLLATMAFEVSTLPVSLTNVLLLVFMTIIVIKSLLSRS